MIPTTESVSKEKTESDRRKPTHIVGIGASAGGLKALQLFFSNMQPETGIAFVIIQHLSPDYKSMMVELLAKTTPMTVCRAEDGMVMEPDHIYLITPRKNITTMNGKLFLAEQPERQGLNLPIDVFFRSLAEDLGERAIGVILSGTGSDGTRGLRAIKAEGGTVFVQDETSAEFDGMPRCAIATGLSDFILSPEHMPEQLLKFISHPRISLPEEPLEVIKKEEDSFSKLMSILKRHTKVDFTYYKPATVIRRIERRMGLVQVPEIDEYLNYIGRNPQEVYSLFKDLLIGVTKFFRDQEAFHALSEKAIPSIIDMARKRNPSNLRVWVVGCSTGEEAYTLAMQIKAYLEASSYDVDVKIFATDIDKQAIETAGAGLYPESIAADVDVGYLSKYFEKVPGGYRIKKEIRQMVIFAVHNIIEDPSFTKIDLIICRNLLIYLQPVLQKKIFHTFNYILQQDGFLFLGNSETVVAVEDSFDDVDSKQRLYIHRKYGEMPPPFSVKKQISREYSVSAAKVAYENQPEPSFTRANTNKEKYYQNIISNIVSTMFVVNETREVMQSFGDTRRYVTLPQGNVSLDILSILPKEVSLAVSSAMQQARKDKREVVYGNIKIREGDGERRVDLRVKAVMDPKENGENLYMILLEEVEEKSRPLRTSLTESQDYLSEERIGDLEREVLFTRENLQATIEELQTTNEELQATNEELLAANEELQSTNEELQSVNEELNTVNAEYQNKVLELTELNRDMDNLMTSSDIPIIFLDKKLCIRKFSAAMPQELNLLKQDVGRPFTDLNVPMLGNFKQDAASVIKDGNPIEKIIRYKEEWYLQRILPFVHEQKTIEGVVLTLVRITEQKKAEIALENQHKLLLSVLDSTPSATLLIDIDGNINFANQRAVETLGIDHSILLKMKINSKKIRFTDLDGRPIKKSDEPFFKVMSSSKPLEKYILCLEKENGSKLVLNINANPVFSVNKKLDGAVFRMDPVAFENNCL